MRISKEEVEKLAHLARLEFSDDEKLRMQADMDKILGFVDKINELDLAGVEPLVYLNEDRNVMRTDKIEQRISKDDALRNSPERDSDYFRVPKVLKREE
jgi:aspartyl-tRNA(Asn)/glutamyl-tRNA(Gln) amidotransferase subunit C